MRLVNYEVAAISGVKFYTTNHKEATEGGNRIERVFLTDFTLEPETPEQEKARLDHIEKVNKYLTAKRA